MLFALQTTSEVYLVISTNDVKDCPQHYLYKEDQLASTFAFGENLSRKFAQDHTSY